MDGWSRAFCDWLQSSCSRDNTWLLAQIVFKEHTVGSQDTEILGKAQITV